MEYSRGLNLDPEDTVEFVLEIQYKLEAIVGYNRFGGAIDLVDIINVKAGYILRSCGLKIREGDGLLI